jgi:hypothetical protein
VRRLDGPGFRDTIMVVAFAPLVIDARQCTQSANAQTGTDGARVNCGVTAAK